MMAKTAIINIKTDSDTIESVETLYFPRYNSDTLAAFDEVEHMKRHPHKYNGCRNIKDLFEELDTDDEV